MFEAETVARLALIAIVACLASSVHATGVAVIDDDGRPMTFDRAPARVVTLAPSLTELVFAAGGGRTLVARDAHSDFPVQARRLPSVGEAARLDIEAIVALRPDLVIAWRHGNTAREIEQIESAGVRVFRLEPQRLDDVALAIERLGRIFGTEPVADASARGLRNALDAERSRHRSAAPVRVFYQVWSSPLMTISRGQIVSEAIELCGGRNVFADLQPLVPQVSTEAVLAANPEVVLSADELGGADLLRRSPRSAEFARWLDHPGLSAAEGRWFYVLNGDAISRQGPRIAGGVSAVCAALDEVRRERAAPRAR